MAFPRGSRFVHSHMDIRKTNCMGWKNSVIKIEKNKCITEGIRLARTPQADWMRMRVKLLSFSLCLSSPFRSTNSILGFPLFPSFSRFVPAFCSFSSPLFLAPVCLCLLLSRFHALFIRKKKLLKCFQNVLFDECVHTLQTYPGNHTQYLLTDVKISLCIRLYC